MKQFFLALALALMVATASATPLSQSNAWFDRECATSFGSTEWRHASDSEVEANTLLYLARLGINIRATPVVCSGAPFPFQLTEGQLRIIQGETYLFMAINADFRGYMGSEMRGAIALLVARSVLSASSSCNAYLDVHDFTGYLKCEHELDKFSDGLAERGEVSQALRKWHQYADRNLSPIHNGQADRLMRILHGRIILLDRSSRVE